jgi:Co/Zn/Cd efflux system component
MDECCEVREIPREQRRTLQIVLLINAVMFLTESVAGVLAHSTALFADSLDMLGDAIVYGFSLYVIGRGIAWQARAALLKGLIMAAFGIGLLVQVAFKITRGVTPTVEVMGVVGTLAFAANLWCLALLWRRRGDDINMRSAWICSRNDVIGNAAVLVAAGAVAVTGSPWPDIVIGLLVASVFGRSAVQVVRDASRAVAASG